MKDSEECSTFNESKGECDYGEKCYRKNPAHFKEYKHQHLNDLLNTAEKVGFQSFPDGYKPKVSKQTIIEQLNILRSFKSKTTHSSNSSEEKAGNSRVQISGSTSCNVPPNSSDSQRKRLSVNERNNEPHMKEKLKKYSNAEQGDTTGAAGSNITPRSEYSDTSKTLTSKEHSQNMQAARNMSEAMTYFQEVKKRSLGSIVEKHEAAAPYYFFLTSVTDSKKTHSEKLSLQMFDILDPSLGDLESSLQINCMVEFGWLMAQYHVANQRGKPLTLLYGEMDVANLDFKNVTAVSVKPPSPFGCHHTKMCVLAYRDGSVRVCVHTANLVESDWDNRVQGVWLSPICPALALDADSNAGESPTQFKQDLIQYLSAYRLAQLQPWIGKLRRADFSHINVFFVASTPGSHKGVDSAKWGHAKLASLLKRHVTIMPRSGCAPPSWQVIAQASSIGSLGPQPTAWFCGEVKQAMSGGVGMGLQALPPIRMIYPSFENVAASYDGLLGGGCLPYSMKTHGKQPWLQQYLYQWKSDKRHRTRAMPHIKSYCRVSPDYSQLAWFHLTSANLSKAAWGSLTKAGAISILSYEAGVLLLPKFVLGSASFPIKQEAAPGVPLFPMPYDLPLTQYNPKDVPWFVENLT